MLTFETTHTYKLVNTRRILVSMPAGVGIQMDHGYYLSITNHVVANLFMAKHARIVLNTKRVYHFIQMQEYRPHIRTCVGLAPTDSQNFSTSGSQGDDIVSQEALFCRMPSAPHM